LLVDWQLHQIHPDKFVPLTVSRQMEHTLTLLTPAPLTSQVTLTPRESAARGLDLLAERLDPIIATTLAPHLQGLSWTVLLQEIDRLKGKIPHTYNATDVQAQLRVLTERLGNIGYPFDDYTRAVSSVAGELRIVRNRLFHMDDITLLDAWRALDFVVRLLARLGDEQGSAAAEAMRDGILRLTPPTAVVPDVDDEAEDEDAEAAGDYQHVDPDPEVFRRETGDEDRPRTGLSNERLEYEPWKVVVVGDVSVLNNLKRQDNAEMVRSVIEEIVDHEGPLHIKRLTRLAGRAFGLGRVETKRVNQIKHQVKQTSATEFEGWVWPMDLDPAEWTEFRPNSSAAKRAFGGIAPQEIRNASDFLWNKHPNDSEDAHNRRILQTFGKKRMTKAVRQHLASSLSA
jgi:hypothetical protein